MGHVRNYSEETASMIDNEIKSIVSNAYNKTEDILKEHMDKLHEVARFLFVNEKMSGEEFTAIMEGTSVAPEIQLNTELGSSSPSDKA
jgi:cell division protease FtsH